MPNGIKNGRSKLSEEDVKKIYLDKTSTKASLSRQYKVDSVVITRIKSGNNWKHVTNKLKDK